MKDQLDRKREIKKQKQKNKRSKKVCQKRKLKFQGYKNCLEEPPVENKISYLEKNKIDVDSHS